MDDKCLTDEEVTAYVDGVVDATLRQRIEAHLSRCPVCLHTVAELKELVSPDAARTPVPESVLSRAEGIITAHSHGSVKLDIVAVLKGGICRILDTTGELLTPRRPLVAPVRSGRRRSSSPRIAKSLSGYLVTIELNASHDDVKPVLTLNEEATSAKPDGIRTRLYSSGACETKYTHNGKVTFSSLARGLFRIEIEDVGAVDLEIK